MATPRPSAGKAINVTELHHHWTQRIDDFLSGGPGSACRPSRCLVWRRGHRGRSVSRGSRAGAGRPASWCVAAGPSRSRMASTLHLFDAGALRRIPPRSGSQGFGPVGGLAMLAAGDQINHSVALSQERSLEAVDLSRLGAGVVRSFLKMRRRHAKDLPVWSVISDIVKRRRQSGIRRRLASRGLRVRAFRVAS